MSTLDSKKKHASQVDFEAKTNQIFRNAVKFFLPFIFLLILFGLPFVSFVLVYVR